MLGETDEINNQAIMKKKIDLKKKNSTVFVFSDQTFGSDASSFTLQLPASMWFVWICAKTGIKHIFNKNITSDVWLNYQLCQK